MGGNLSWQVITLSSLVAMCKVIVEIWCFSRLKSKIPHYLASICHYFLSLKHMACHGHTHKISGPRHNILLVCPMKDLPMLATDDYGDYFKKFCHSVQKKVTRRKGSKKLERQLKSFLRYQQTQKPAIAIAKLFTLHKKAINISKLYIIFQIGHGVWWIANAKKHVKKGKIGIIISISCAS